MIFRKKIKRIVSFHNISVIDKKLLFIYTSEEEKIFEINGDIFVFKQLQEKGKNTFNSI